MATTRTNHGRRRPRGVVAGPLGPPKGGQTAIEEQRSTVKVFPDWRARIPQSTRELLQHHKARARAQLGELPELLLRERDPQQPEVFDPQAGFYDEWENLYTVSNFPFVVGTASVQIIPANPRRTYLAIQNKSAGTIYVNFGTSANTFSGLRINTGGDWDFQGGERGGSCVPGDSVHIIGSAAGLQGIVIEGVKLLAGLTAD